MTVAMTLPFPLSFGLSVSSEARGAPRGRSCFVSPEYTHAQWWSLVVSVPRRWLLWSVQRVHPHTRASGVVGCVLPVTRERSFKRDYLHLTVRPTRWTCRNEGVEVIFASGLFCFSCSDRRLFRYVMKYLQLTSLKCPVDVVLLNCSTHKLCD